MSLTTDRPAGQSELTKERIIAAISAVEVPEVERGLVELNMVPAVEINGRDVTLTVELLTPVTPAAQRGQIEADLRAALATLPQVGGITVNWTSRVRASGSGKSDAEPIKGVKNTIAVASG